jgi:hypothetical protein
MAAMVAINDDDPTNVVVDEAGVTGGPAGAFEGVLAAPVVVMTGMRDGAVTFMVVVTGIWLVVVLAAGAGVSSGTSVGAATGASATGAVLVVLVPTGAGVTSLPSTGGPPAMTGAAVGVVAFGNNMARSSALKRTSSMVWMIPLLAWWAMNSTRMITTKKEKDDSLLATSDEGHGDDTWNVPESIP